jgi:hypothetical protein
MCGRVFVKSTIPDIVWRFEFACNIERMGNGFSGAPSLDKHGRVRVGQVGAIAPNGMFRKAYGRCVVPVDGDFEWQKLDTWGKKKRRSSLMPSP